jgi:hypothetical protein
MDAGAPDYGMAGAPPLVRRLTMLRFGQGKPMDVQARAVLRKSLSLTSRHSAKIAAAGRPARSTVSGPSTTMRCYSDWFGSSRQGT